MTVSTGDGDPDGSVKMGVTALVAVTRGKSATPPPTSSAPVPLLPTLPLFNPLPGNSLPGA